MKRLAKRIFSLMLVLMLSVCGVLGYSSPVKAAEKPVITITPLVTDSYNKQAFNVYVSCEGAQYRASTGETGTLNPGDNYKAFGTSDTVTIEVVAPYTNDYGGASTYSVIADSINTYTVTAYCKDEAGNILGSQALTLSKYNNPEVVYNAPATIDSGKVIYTTATPTIVFTYGEGDKTITYSSSEKGARSYTVNYVDETNTVIYSATNTMNYGDTAHLEAPATYEKDGNTYLLKTAAAYDVTYENAASVYTFEYVKQIPAPQTPYDITIHLNDENGALLYSFKQGLDVGGSVNIELPKTYEINFKKYVLAEGEPLSIVREFASTDATEYNITYVLSEETAPYDITINLVDYENGNVLSAATAQVTPDGEPYIYDISSNNALTINDVEYQVMSGQGNEAGQIVHTYGDSLRSYNVYYTSKVIDNPESYPVTMRYICVNDNEVLLTETQDVAFNSNITFAEAPQTVTVEGKEYIRLNGQEGETVHSYNSSQDSYAIYYRDASVPVKEEPIVITQTVTQYVLTEDGTAVTNEDGTTVPETVEVTTITTPSNASDETDDGEETAETEDTNGTESAEDATTVSETTETTYNEAGEQVEFNEAGQLVTVEEEEVPLAGEADLSLTSEEEEEAEEAVVASSSASPVSILLVVAAAALGFFLFFLYSRRRRNTHR